MYKRVKNRNHVIIIDGVKYWNDKPHTCPECRFWKASIPGCLLAEGECYYMLGHKRSGQTFVCVDCPYTNDGVCVTLSCYRELHSFLCRMRGQE